MPETTRQRRLVAILAADVAGYTRLVEEDTDGTVTAWKAARDDVINPLVQSKSGHIIKFTGDGFLVEFPSVQDAVACAIALQGGLASNALKFRMGINLGDIVDDGGDVHGEGVNIAARLEAMAEPGGICISGDVYSQVRNRIDADFTDIGEHQVKHVSHPVRVYTINSSFPKAPNPASTKFVENSPRRSASRPLLTALSTLLVVVMGSAGYFLWDRQKPPPPVAATRLLILPYQSVTANAQLHAEALSENLWLTMARLKGMSMVPRSAAQTLAGVDPTPAQIDKLGEVTHILVGAVTKSGDETRISSRLLRVFDGKRETVWQQEDSAGSKDLFAVLNRQKSAVISELKLALNVNERAVINQTFTANPAAFVDYARAEHIYNTLQWNKFREALDLFKSAYEADSAFVAAKLGYAKTNFHVWQVEWSNVRNTLEARLAAEKTVGEVLATDPNNPEALSLQVTISMRMLRRNEALALANAAIFKNPNSPTNRNSLGWVLLATGDPDNARKEFETYFKTAPRLSEIEIIALSNAYLKLNDPQRALSLLLPLHDDSAPYQSLDPPLAETYARAGDIDAAKRILERFFRAVPGYSLAWIRPFYDIYVDPSIYGTSAKALSAAGMPEWPYNLDKVLAANRLDEEGLRALIDPGFKTVSATDELGGHYYIEVRSDGTVEWRNSFLPNVYRGVWKFEGDRFCSRFPDLYKDRYTCDLFFTDPDKDTPKLRHYVMLSSFGARKLAIERRAE